MKSLIDILDTLKEENVKQKAKELKIGENNIEVIVTSESGVANKINLKINFNS